MEMMEQEQNVRQINTVVIGSGQAGLAAGYWLKQREIEFLIIDGAKQVGDSWRRRWDSLELFTPAQFNNLPGMAFPAPAGHLPGKDEMADYLAAYTQRFQLPLQMDTWVRRLNRQGDSYRIETNRGDVVARHVVVATGAYQKQRIPGFADDLDPAIQQLSSDRYRNPAQLPDGSVLVVGAGNSGAQIALDVADGRRRVWLSGRNTGHMKRTLLGKDIFWWLTRTVFKVRADSWLGHRLRQKLVGQGAALLDIDEAELAAAGVRRVGRTTGARHGLPVTTDGQVLNVDAIVWATGFRPDFSWIERPIFQEDGFPVHQHGVVTGEPGLYFLGLPFLYRGNSSLVGGVGADARHVVEVLAGRTARALSPAGAVGNRPVMSADRAK